MHVEADKLAGRGGEPAVWHQMVRRDQQRGAPQRARTDHAGVIERVIEMDGDSPWGKRGERPERDLPRSANHRDRGLEVRPRKRRLFFLYAIGLRRLPSGGIGPGRTRIRTEFGRTNFM
jgi:hypothetical protein